MSRSDSFAPGARRAAFTCFVLLILALPWSIAPMSVTAALCGALTVPLWLAARKSEWLRTPVTWPALGWLAALVLSATLAVDSASSWGRVPKGLFPALVPLAAWHIRSPDRGRRALVALFASAAVAWTVALAIHLTLGDASGRARGPSGHYMTFAGQLALILCVALGVALVARGRWRIAAMCVSVLGVVCLALTLTRSAWLGVGSGLVAMLAMTRPRAILAVLAAGVLVVVLAPGSFGERLRSVVNPIHPTNVERVHMWRAGVRMFLDRPVTGVGLMDLKPIYERYRDPDARERAGHLHSVPVQIAATMGTLGVVAFLALYASLVRCASSGLRAQLRQHDDDAIGESNSGTDRVATGFRLGVFGALVAFAIAGLFEWNFGDEELLYALYTLAGIAWAIRGSEGAAAPHER